MSCGHYTATATLSYNVVVAFDEEKNNYWNIKENDKRFRNL